MYGRKKRAGHVGLKYLLACEYYESVVSAVLLMVYSVEAKY
jgi:hypothetical protein